MVVKVMGKRYAKGVGKNGHPFESVGSLYSV